MKKYFILMLAVVAMSCADPNLKPIVTFEDAGHGAYPRLIADSEDGELLVDMLSQAAFDASFYEYGVEFVDDNKGNNVVSYVLMVEYVSAAGISQGPVELLSFGTADFTTSEGFAAVTNIRITAQFLADKFGLTYATMNVGDAFKVTGTITLTDDRTFTGPTSSATVNGAAFQGQFDYSFPVTCPTTLIGSYDFVTDLSGWRQGDNSGSTSGTVDIFKLASGAYSFSDWSFGGYLAEYKCCTPAGDFHFTEQCDVVNMFAATDEYGDEWTFVGSSIDLVNNTWTIDWENFTYANSREQGVTIISFPNGVPFGTLIVNN